MPGVCPCGGVVRSRPVAQAIVLRRVLTGGISANRCLAAQAGSKYGSGSLRGPGPGTLAGMIRRVVFGTLLGPEATGPGCCGFGCGGSGTCVSGFLAAPIMRLVPFVGARVGCVVRGCCLRTT